MSSWPTLVSEKTSRGRQTRTHVGDPPAFEGLVARGGRASSLNSQRSGLIPEAVPQTQTTFHWIRNDGDTYDPVEELED